MKISFQKTLKRLQTLILGSFFSFIVNTITLYYLSVFFSKEQFGVYALFASTVTILSILATLRMEYVIVLQKTIKEALYYCEICFAIIKSITLVSLFVFLLLWLFSVSFFSENAKLWFLLMPVAYCQSIVTVLLSYNNKIKNYKEIANFKLLYAISLSITGVSFGFLKVEYGLIISFLIANLIGMLYLKLIFQMRKKYKRNPISFSIIGRQIEVNKDIIINSLGIDLVLSLTKLLPNYMLSFYYGNAIVGLYDMALKILNIPKNIISANIGELYYQKAVVFHHKGKDKYKKITNRTLFFLLTTAIFCYTPFLFFGKELFTLVLGEKWEVSGEITQIMAVYYILIFITSPMAYIYYIKRCLKELFIFCVVSLSVKVIAFLFFTYQNSMTTIFNYLYVSIFLEAILLFLIIKNSYFNLREEVKT